MEITADSFGMPMPNTTNPKGLNQREYNALMHAIWRADRDLKEMTNIYYEPRIKLEAERKVLSDLFNRLTEPPQAEYCSDCGAYGCCLS